MTAASGKASSNSTMLRMSAPRHPKIDWSLSPTTHTLWCSAASMSTISFWARLVSWNSSTSTCLNRVRYPSRTSGAVWKSRTVSSSRSSKSMADAANSRRSYSW